LPRISVFNRSAMIDSMYDARLNKSRKGPGSVFFQERA
jgi:hypothetical protein